MNERICACGCGERFVPKRGDQKYKSRECRELATLKRQAQATQDILDALNLHCEKCNERIEHPNRKDQKYCPKCSAEVNYESMNRRYIRTGSREATKLPIITLPNGVEYLNNALTGWLLKGSPNKDANRMADMPIYRVVT